MSMAETVTWSAHFLVEKYDPDQTAWVRRQSGMEAPQGHTFTALGVRPFAVVEHPRNLITTNGLNRIANLLIGSGQAATATAVRIGVGNSSTAAAAGQTDLQAASGSANRWFQVMDSTFPSVSGAVATFKASVASGDGNFAWQEWCLDIGTPTVSSGATVNALMLNRKVASNGTKSSGSVWVATATISFSG